MGDHFTLQFDDAELTTAMTKLSWLEEQLGTGGEGGKLATLHGNAGAWTGAAATTLLGEMGVIARTMTGASAKFGDAHDAVKTFQTALDHARNDLLPKLNKRWEDAEDAYRSTTSWADTNDVQTDEGRQQTINDAGTTRSATERQINGDYDAMVTTLKTAAKTCGTALAAATMVHFSAEQWKQVKGGSIPLGLKFLLRSQIFGPDTVLHHSDGLVVGHYVGQQLNNEAGHKDTTDLVDPDLVALMEQYGTDPGFAEGLLTTLGPGGTAYLAYRVNELLNWSDKDGAKSQGKELMPIVSAILKTGSNVSVTTADGSSVPLMDAAWLDGFDPRNYASLSDVNKGVLESGNNWPTGYQPGLLLPFLTAKDAVSPRFATVIAQRALDDYEASHKDGQLLYDTDAGRRWALYDGFGLNTDYNTRTGKTDDPFGYDVFHIAMERASDYGSSSNAVMIGHRDTMLMLMTGGDPSLVGGHDVYGQRHDWMSGTLGTILQQATTGYQGSDPQSADGALWGVADYLAHHGDAHLLHNVDVALGNVVTDPRMFNGAMSSVTGPNFAGDGYLDDPTHPGAGPLMSRELWARLHQEAMLVPETAAKLIGETGDFINGTGNSAQHLGYVWDPAKKELVPNTHVTALTLYQAEAARNFLGTNLLADHDQLVTAMENELEQVHESKDKAKAIVGQMVDWASDPKSILPDVAGKLKDFAIDTAVDWAFPSDSDIEGRYNSSIDALTKDLNSSIVQPGFWDDVNQKAGQVVRDISSGAGPGSVDAVVPGYTDASGHHVFPGDPTTYVGHQSQYVGGSYPIITDDFLTYGADHKPNGVLPVSEMNTLQRNAYLAWLHDPAMQQYLDGELSAVEEARQRAQK